MRSTTNTRFRGRHALLAIVAATALVAGACSSADLQEGGIPPATAAVPTLTAAQVERSTGQLDRIIADVMDQTSIPGVAVAVVHDDQVVYTQGYGVREAGTDTPVDAETVFQLASLSKPIGSTVVAGLVGDGTVAWDEPMVEIKPDFELSNAYVTENATLADLYSHRSGLPGFAGNDLETMGFDQATIIERLRELPLDPFRITYSYSNFAMTTAGVAAAGAAGLTFTEAAQKELFGPTGMSSSSFSHADFLARQNRAALHSQVDGEWKATFTREPDAQAPAGGGSSNVVDMAQWMRLQLADGMLDGTRIIDGEALAETHRLHVNTRPGADPALPTQGYGLGWNVGQSEVEPSLAQWGHSGAFSVGAATTVTLIPELGLGITVLTNAAPIGAAEAISALYVDTLLNGQPTQDWLAMWRNRFAPLLAAPAYEVPPTPTPARDDRAYVGAYENAYFGRVAISEAEGRLVMAWGPDLTRTLDLQHFDGDTFLYADYPEIEGGLTPLVFEFTGGTSASSMVLGAGKAAGSWMVLSRVS